MRLNENLFQAVLVLLCMGIVGAGQTVSNQSSTDADFLQAESVNKRHTEYRQDDIKVSFSLAISRVVLNQPVPVRFLVENNSDFPINLDLGANLKENFLFTIIYPDGTRADLPQYSLGPMGGFHIQGNISLQPQKTYSKTYILNEWADLSKTGAYRIEVKLKTPIETIEAKAIRIPSFLIEFEIEPEDEEYIKELCEAYLKRLENANYSEGGEIGHALIFFRSPVAVPYIRRALASKNLVPHNMINFLRDRPSIVGVDSLIGFVKDQPESDSTNYARSALEFIRKTTKNEILKQRIESVFAY